MKGVQFTCKRVNESVKENIVAKAKRRHKDKKWRKKSNLFLMVIFFYVKSFQSKLEKLGTALKFKGAASQNLQPQFTVFV